MSVKQKVGAGGFWVEEDCNNRVNTETASFAGQSCQFQIPAPGTQLTVGSKSFDLYGQPHTVRVHANGSAN